MLQLFTINLSRHPHIVFREPDTEKEKKNNQRVYRWRKKEPPQTNKLPSENVFIPVPWNIDISTPAKYFKQFWDDNITEMVVKKINLCSVEKSGASINTNKDEIGKFLGIQMLMSIVKMPRYGMYWSQETCYEPISTTLSLKWYKKSASFYMLLITRRKTKKKIKVISALKWGLYFKLLETIALRLNLKKANQSTSRSYEQRQKKWRSKKV